MADQITTTVRTISGTPDRDDPDNFNTESDAFFEDLPGAITDINAVAGEMNTVASSVETDAADAESASAVSLAAANFQGSWSSQTGAAAIPYSVLHDSKFWMLNTGLADVTAKEPGVDVEWTQIGALDGTAIDMEDTVLTRPKFLDVSETVNVLGDLAGGTDDIDLEDGNVVTATVSTSEQTFTFSNPPASGSNGSFTLFLTNGGSQTVNWPGSVDWPAATAPTLTAAGVDVLVFTTNDGGTTWLGFLVGLDIS